MENKYPYIKGDQIVIGRKFVGDEEISLYLPYVQQFMASMGAYQELDKALILMKESLEEVGMTSDEETIKDMAFHYKRIKKVQTTLKQYMP